MAVFRVHKNENYTVLSNYHFKEKGMTLKAKGLLSLMLSLPENWDYSAAGLVTLSKDGKDSVNAALKELEKFGYLRRTQAYDSSGKFKGYNYEIFEQPTEVKAVKPTTEKPFAENPSTVKPTTEKPPQLNKKELKTKKSNTKKLNTEEVEEKKEKRSSGYDAVINKMIFNSDVKKSLYEFIKMRKMIKRPLTDFALKELIFKLKDISDVDEVQIEVLNKSIMNAWADIFPIKEGKQQQQGNVTPLFDGEIDTAEEAKLQRFFGNIMLSDKQMGDLLDKMGLEMFDYYADKLSNYIKENGPVIGHYQTLLRWYKQDSAVAR